MVKKFSLLVIIVLIGLSGCGKQASRKSGSSLSASNNISSRMSKYDESIGAFVLEDPKDYDLFGEEEKEETGGKTEIEPFAWQELDDLDQEEGHILYFEYDSDEVLPTERAKLKKNAKEAKQALSAGATIILIILIEGHACLIAHSEVYNTALSQRRAEQVAREYARLGVPRSKMKVVGRGASRAVCFDEKMDAQAVNRRVETKMVYTQEVPIR